MKKRDSQYEVIRVVAMFFVVGVHVVGSLPVDSPLRMFDYYFLSLVFYTCNGLFYILSGKFSLQSNPKSQKEYFHYYYKKITNLIIPMLFYMCLRSAYEAKWQINSIKFWEDCLNNILYGYSGSEYWFLYGLVGNLLLAPFISKAFLNASKKELYLFVALAFGYNALITYASYFLEGGVAWSYSFGGWSIYFYLGYCLERIIDSKQKQQIIIVLGIVSFIISLIQKYLGLLINIHDLAPTYILITCAMFLLIKNIKISNEWKMVNQLIAFMGKHSFSVYMVHIVVMNKVMTHIPFVNHYLFYLIVITTLVVIFSVIIGAIIDNTFIALLKIVIKKGIEKTVFLVNFGKNTAF